MTIMTKACRYRVKHPPSVRVSDQEVATSNVATLLLIAPEADSFVSPLAVLMHKHAPPCRHGSFVGITPG